MSEEWVESTLGGVLERVKRPVVVEEGHIYPAVSVTKDGQGLGEKEPFIGGKTNYKRLFEVKFGDVVVRTITAFESPVGVARAKHDGSFVSQVFLTYEVGKRAVPEYLALVFQTQGFWREMQNRAQGTVLRRKTISDEAFCGIPFLLPPLVVQRRIVDLMAHLDTHITNLRAERDSAEELLFGTRDEILKVQDGWNQTSLGDICTKIGSGATPRGGESSYRPDGVSLIRSQNVYDLRFEMQGLAHIGPNQARLLEGVTVEDGDILLNITGASVNRCCVVPTQVLPARVNQHVAIIRARREKVRSDFLVHLLRRRDNLRLLDRMAGAGTTRQALTKKQIEEFEVSLPDLSEQARLAGILDALRATVASLQVEVEAQSAARTVLLSALMSGDVILPNDYDSLLSQVA